jgi:uncharacterized protein
MGLLQSGLVVADGAFKMLLDGGRPGERRRIQPARHGDDRERSDDGRHGQADDPHYSENGIDGLEYLHGIWDGGTFTAIWAHDHAEERVALIRLFEIFDARLSAHPTTFRQRITAPGLPATGAHLIPVDHAGRSQMSPEEIDAIASTVRTLLGGEWTDKDGATRALLSSDVIVVAPYNLQVDALAEALPGIRVGTVDRFQGQEAPVAIVSMTASAPEDVPRGMDFLLSPNRVNVAISRGKALSLIFASPRLLETKCTTVDQMRLVNALCALPVWTREDQT